jgi:AcrR family transcriptional regulator
MANDVSNASAGTRDLLLEAGERMFAERGFHGVSMREIGLAANQRNNGVTQYHFGDKARLIQAIFVRRAHAVNDRRLELIAAADGEGRNDVHSLVEAYVLPLAEQVEAGTWYVPFLSRLQAEHRRDELLQDVDAGVNSAYDLVRDRIRRDHLAHVPTARFAIRWRIALNLAIDGLADYQALAATSRRHPSLDVFTDELVGAITALLMG